MTTLEQNQEKILEEIAKARQEIKTDGYDMSVGEIISLYNSDEIKLDPAFQRLFRWEDNQKTKLIESILIGIPIPEIFVAQKEDGTWHVVDGVQRLSTIIQMVGALDGYPELTLTSCKYIPHLKDRKWSELPLKTQREFRKSRLKINIILTENSDEAQYELFQRLNTGGTLLTEQEVRNCLMLMLNPDFYELINSLKEYQNFKNCINLPKHNYDQEYHMELILRMFIGYFNDVDYKNHGSFSKINLSDFISKETANLISKADINKFEVVFKKTFDKLYSALGDNAFKKYDINKSAFYGAFNVSVFEMISTGVSFNINSVSNLGDDALKERIENIYSQAIVVKGLARGVKAIQRFKDLTNFSREYFK